MIPFKSFALLVFLGTFLVSSHGKKDYPPYRVEQLNVLEQEVLEEEILERMEEEAILYMQEYCIERDNTSTCWEMSKEPRNIFLIQRNSTNISVKNKITASELIPTKIFKFFTANKHLSAQETRLRIQDPNYLFYNYPFFSFQSRKRILDNINQEKLFINEARAVNNFAFVQFHKNKIRDWNEKLKILRIVNTDTLQEIHPQVRIEIINQFDTAGFSNEAKIALIGLLKVRDAAAIRYFNTSYSDLYYRSTKLSSQKAKKRMEAVNYLYPVRILDEAYFNTNGMYTFYLRPEIYVASPIRVSN